MPQQLPRIPQVLTVPQGVLRTRNHWCERNQRRIEFLYVKRTIMRLPVLGYIVFHFPIMNKGYIVFHSLINHFTIPLSLTSSITNRPRKMMEITFDAHQWLLLELSNSPRKSKMMEITEGLRKTQPIPPNPEDLRNIDVNNEIAPGAP